MADFSAENLVARKQLNAIIKITKGKNNQIINSELHFY